VRVPKQPYLSLKHQAFSLLELAIALIIIGLLIGAIAGLHSYTRNARITTMMSEGQVLISAFNQFQTRYKAPPGDFINANGVWPGAGNGDGNGLIRATGAAPGNRDEWFYTFQHLGLSGFIQGSYTGATTGGPGTYSAKIGTNVPGTSIDKSAFLFDHPDATDGFVSGDPLYFDGTYGNLLRVAGLNDNATSIPDQPFISGKQALQIDDKYDDGKPGLGNIMAPKASALANCASSDIATAAYLATSDDTTCYLFIKMQ
jgi:prepilin-type N-terminal cleavage/methylation domain-containing protein